MLKTGGMGVPFIIKNYPQHLLLKGKPERSSLPKLGFPKKWRLSKNTKLTKTQRSVQLRS
jgi:hypothetical protein